MAKDIRYARDTERGYRAFPSDVTAAILVFQNKGKAAILGYQTSPLGDELYFNAKTVFCLSKPIWRLVTRELKRSIRTNIYRRRVTCDGLACHLGGQ